MAKNENIVVFFDIVGRTIIGEKTKQTNTHISIKNPVVVHIVPNQQTGQMALQLFPAFFKEFQGDKSEDVVFNYPVAHITLSDPIQLDFRLYSQYENMFSNVVVPNNNVVTPAGTPAGDNVVKLFD